MYAVIETGGKQYKVAEDDIIQVEKLDGEAGDTVTLDKVLMLNDGKSVKIGTPTVKGAGVTAEILEQGRSKKILIFKKKRRKNYRRTRGHRQAYTVLKIVSLTGGKKAAAKKTTAKKSASKPAAKETPAKKTAPKKTAAKKTTAKKSASKPAAKKTPAKKAAKTGAKKTGKASGKSGAKKTAAKTKTKTKKPAAKKSAAKGSK